METAMKTSDTNLDWEITFAQMITYLGEDAFDGTRLRKNTVALESEVHNVFKQITMGKSQKVDERDGKWAWVVSVACFSTNFTTTGFLRSGSVLYVAFVRYLDFSREQAAWLPSLIASVMHLSGPPFSFLIQYMTIRKLVIMGSLLSSLGCILCYFSMEYISLIIFLGVINGLGNGLIYNYNPVMINMYFKKYKTSAMGIFRGGASVGSFILPPLMEYLIATYGLRGCFLITGGILLQGVVAAGLYRQPSILKRRNIEDKGSNDKWHIANTALEVAKDPMFLMISFTFAIFFLFLNTYVTIVVDYAVDRQVDTLKAVFLVSAYSVSDMFGRFGSGWIVDLGIAKRVTVAIVCFSLLAGLLCILPFIWNYIAMMALSATIGFLSGCTIIQETVFLSDNLGLKKLPVAVGFGNFITGMVVLLVQAPITGYFREGIGRYDYLFYVLAALLFTSALLWLVEPQIQKFRKKVVTTQEPPS